MGKHKKQSYSSSGDEELHRAARSGDLIAVQTILASNPLSINSRDKHSRTPLHLAAWSGQTEVVNYLCQHKADVGAAAMDDMGAIHFAAQKGHLEVVRALISSGVSVKATNRKGFTPLHYAVQGSHVDLVKYLVKKGASLSAKTKAGFTPMDLATGEEMCSILIEAERLSEQIADSNAKRKAEPGTKPSSHENSQISEEVAEDSEARKDENVKRKDDEEEPKETPQPKRVKVKLNHLLDEEDGADDGEE